MNVQLDAQGTPHGKGRREKKLVKKDSDAGKLLAEHQERPAPK